MLEALMDYDWKQAFGFAGESGVCNSGIPNRALPNDTDTSIAPFTREDVKRIIALSEGVADKTDWLIVGELHDGRFFALSAGCDYTGWD